MPTYPVFRSFELRRRAVGIGALVVAVNVLVWLGALLAFHAHPLLLAMAPIAYGLGLRHAVDADHIAAIDNVTRKLMHDGKRPLAVGLFFSLGHSTVVLLMTVVVVLAARPLSMLSASLRTTGMLVGTCASALFLFTIAAANAAVFVSVHRRFKRLRRGERIAAADMEHMLPVGFIARLCRRLFGLIHHSWQMYPLGLLFGLGFDTASEISLLAMSAVEGSKGLPIVDVLVFPALFLAGISLIDTVDGVAMLGAYGWAFVDPLRKLYYDMTMTLISVAVALFVGGAELLGLVAQRFDLSEVFGGALQAVAANFSVSGYAIVLAFMAAWIASMAIQRLRNYDGVKT